MGWHIWQAGYFVRTTSDEVIADVIRRYIRYFFCRAEYPVELAPSANPTGWLAAG